MSLHSGLITLGHIKRTPCISKSVFYHVFIVCEVFLLFKISFLFILAHFCTNFAQLERNETSLLVLFPRRCRRWQPVSVENMSGVILRPETGGYPNGCTILTHTPDNAFAFLSATPTKTKPIYSVSHLWFPDQPIQQLPDIVSERLWLSCI